MGSIISTTIYQPILLGTAVTLMIIGLIYQQRSSTCGQNTDDWGKEIFKIDVGLSIVLVIAATIINFISGLEV